MSYSLIKAEFNPQTHTSTVTIGTEMGEFTASSACQEIDRLNESKYFGCSIAEMKAVKKYKKAKRNVFRAQRKALFDYAYRMSKTRTYDANAFYVKQLNKEIKTIDAKIQKLNNEITAIELSIVTEIKARDIYLQERNKKND